MDVGNYQGDFRLLLTFLRYPGQMRSHLTIRRMILPGVVYGVAAAFSIGLTRAGGGVAMFWIATAMLVPLLGAWPVRLWWPTLAACWVASVVATGTIGFGWELSPFLATANCTEAVIGALLLRRVNRRFPSYLSLPWMGWALAAGVLVAPLFSGVIATAAIVWFKDLSASRVFTDWMISHGMGFVCVFPIAGLLIQARLLHRSILPPPEKRGVAAASFAAVIVAGTVCFGQSTVPLLFLPILVLMYVMVFTDLTVSALALFVLVIMGVGSALLGIGPLRLMSIEQADRFLFLQFYIVCMALPAIPIALLLEKRRKMFAALVESEARYRLLADFSTDIIMVSGNNGEIRYISPSIRQLGDYDPKALVGTATEALIAPQHRAEMAEAYLRVLRNPGATASIEFLGITRSNGLRWFESHMRGIFRDDGSVDGVCSIVRDIATRKRRESELRAVSLTDPLTNLANRRAFDIFMASAIKHDDESYVALFDLDHFKLVNEGFGHATGDLVIEAFARAARGVLRDSDLIARIGGEEFAVHLPDTTLAQTRLICERIRAAFVHEGQLAAPQVGPISVSVGISLCRGPLDDVLRLADTALHKAKASGRDCLAIAA